MYSYCYVRSVLRIVYVQMCTVLLPPGVNPNVVNKYTFSYICIYAYTYILLWGLLPISIYTLLHSSKQETLAVDVD
jgi:hypothetical protein